MDYEQGYKELVTIINNPRWNPTEKVFNAVLRIKGHSHEHEALSDGRIPLFDLTEDQLAAVVNVSRSTIHDCFKKSQSAGLLDRNVDQRWVGEQLDTHSVTQLNPLPDVLPSMPEAPRAERSRRSSAKFREVAEKLMEMACPECGAVGKWHLTCGECGNTWTTEDLAHSETPENTGRETFPTSDFQNFDTPTSVVSEIPTPDTTKAGDYVVAVLSETPSPLDSCDEVFPPGDAAPPPVADEFIAAMQADPDPADILEGPATIDFLVDYYYPGINFYMAEPRSKKIVIPRDDEGHVLPWDHISPDACKRWLDAGGSVGIVGDGYLSFVDTDEDLHNLQLLYSQMDGLCKVHRNNAPDRAKLMVLLPGNCPTRHYKREDGYKHNLDLLGRDAKIIVAGTHESGERIKLWTGGRIPALTLEELDDILTDWEGPGTQAPPKPSTSPPTQAREHKNTRDDLDVKTAIRWYLSLPEVNAEIDSINAACPKQGKYIAHRADDRTPSVVECKDAHSESHGRMFHDYGTGRTYDGLDLISMKTGTPKTDLIKRAIQEYRQAHEPIKVGER